MIQVNIEADIRINLIFKKLTVNTKVPISVVKISILKALLLKYVLCINHLM